MSLSIRYWLAERHIDITQVGHSATPIAGVSFRIAQEMEVKSLTTFDITTLVEVLELPLTPAVQVVEPLAQITIGLLQTLSHKKPLKRNEGTWLTFQIAYLKALQAILQQESQLRRPWCDRARVPSIATDEPLNDSQLQVLLKTLRPGRLSDSQAEQALSQVGDSFLVQQMNQLTQAWFIANGAEETEAKLLVQRLINGLPGYLLAAIAENPLPLAQLQKFVRVGNLTNLRDYGEADTSTLATIPLDPDRERIRASLLQSQGEPLLGELFSLKDIYVPLQGVRVEMQEQTPPESVDLMDWALSQLEDLTKIAVVEADSGCGKTSFCQMLACRVAQDLYPAWFPLLIRLKDVTLGETLEQTLGPIEVSLTTPCLLILDGLADLPRSPNPRRQLEVFWHQLAQFQANSHHKILLTRHPSPQEKLPLSVAKIRILPMGQEEFRQWFKHWARLQSKAIAQSYFSFLKNAKVFQLRPELKDLAHRVSQPLMLYLLGILHRDGLLDESILKLNSPQLEFEIYERIYRWLLGDSDSAVMPGGRKGLAHAYRSSEAISNLRQDRSPQSLRADFQTLALSLLQTGRVTAIQSKERMPALFFKERKKEGLDHSNYVLEFSHTNFKDYLGGVEIATRLFALTEQQFNRYQGISFVISSPVDVAQTLYQTLGYGILSSAIQDTIIERLRQAEHHPNTLKTLFERLYPFYHAYCLGRWLDEGIAHQVHAQLQAVHNSLTVLQIDAAVGLNLFCLLCAIASLAKIPFTPCGNPNLILEFDPDRLLTLIGRTTVLSPLAWQQVKPNLSHIHLIKARLNRAWLSETNLQGANLSSAELIETNLSNANLMEANLTWANLAGANLSGANLFKAKLEGADLSGANLLGANLREANLTNACLFQTRLDEESKMLSTIDMAIFSPTEFEDYRRSIPSITEGFTETAPGFQVYLIESAEGEPMLPDDATIQVNPEKSTASDPDSNSDEDAPTVYLENLPKDSLWTTDLNNTETTLLNEPTEEY